MKFNGQMKSIQILRGIAALMVLFTHIGFKSVQLGFNESNFFPYGGYGVDIFFMISGFIMMLVTAKKRKKTEFIVDRFIRIIPAYWSVTLLALFAFMVAPNLVNSSGGTTGIFQSFTLIKIPFDVKFLVNNGWTLSFEFLFYFSLLFLINKSHSVKAILLFLVFTLMTCMYYLNSNSDYMLFYSVIKYEFILGMSLFLILSDSKNEIIIGLILSILSLIIISINRDISLDVRALPVLIIATAILLVILQESKINDKNTFFKFLLYAGNISYSLYLIHPFSLQAASIIIKTFGSINNLHSYFTLSVILSFISAHMLYIIVEKNVSIRLKDIYRRGV